MRAVCAALLSGCLVVVAGCSSYTSGTQASAPEQADASLLSAAGFRMIPADTPQKQQVLVQLPADQLRFYRNARGPRVADKNSEAAARIRSLYEANPGIRAGSVSDKEATDFAAQEFRVLIDTFLGENYDAAKVESLSRLHRQMQVDRLALADKLRRRELSAQQYLDHFNALLSSAFKKFEDILGPDDFKRLFGARPEDVGQLVDRDTFLGKRS